MSEKKINNLIRKVNSKKRRGSIVFFLMVVVAWILIYFSNGIDISSINQIITVGILVLFTLFALYLLVYSFVKKPTIIRGTIIRTKELKRTERFSEEREKIRNTIFLVQDELNSYWGYDISGIIDYEHKEIRVGDEVIILIYGGRRNYIIK